MTAMAPPEEAGRILLTIDSLEPGGAERHVVDLARALQRRAWSVTVACPVAGALAAELRAAGVPLVVLGSSAVKRRISLSYGVRLVRLLRQEQFDLVHAHLY